MLWLPIYGMIKPRKNFSNPNPTKNGGGVGGGKKAYKAFGYESSALKRVPPIYSLRVGCDAPEKGSPYKGF